MDPKEFVNLGGPFQCLTFLTSGLAEFLFVLNFGRLELFVLSRMIYMYICVFHCVSHPTPKVVWMVMTCFRHTSYLVCIEMFLDIHAMVVR